MAWGIAFTAASLLMSCAGPQRQTWEDPYKGGAEDAFLLDDDLGCMQGWDQVGRSRFTNVNGHLEETLAVARGGEGGHYPVGTLVQLSPAEAMVKRGEGFSPETGDWEFFKLDVVDGQTVITERGTTGIKNIAGTCAGCHDAASSWDFVCAEGHGCDPLPGFVVKKAVKLAAKDARCEGRE